MEKRKKTTQDRWSAVYAAQPHSREIWRTPNYSFPKKTYLNILKMFKLILLFQKLTISNLSIANSAKLLVVQCCLINNNRNLQMIPKFIWVLMDQKNHQNLIFQSLLASINLSLPWNNWILWKGYVLLKPNRICMKRKLENRLTFRSGMTWGHRGFLLPNSRRFAHEGLTMNH